MDAFEAPWGEYYPAGLLEPVEVHQATGILIERLGVSGQDALARLRGHAAVTDQPLADVADAVIDRLPNVGL